MMCYLRQADGDMPAMAVHSDLSRRALRVIQLPPGSDYSEGVQFEYDDGNGGYVTTGVSLLDR